MQETPDRGTRIPPLTCRARQEKSAAVRARTLNWAFLARKWALLKLAKLVSSPAPLRFRSQIKPLLLLLLLLLLQNPKSPWIQRVPSKRRRKCVCSQLCLLSGGKARLRQRQPLRNPHFLSSPLPRNRRDRGPEKTLIYWKKRAAIMSGVVQ